MWRWLAAPTAGHPTSADMRFWFASKEQILNVWEQLNESWLYITTLFNLHTWKRSTYWLDARVHCASLWSRMAELSAVAVIWQVGGRTCTTAGLQNLLTPAKRYHLWWPTLQASVYCTAIRCTCTWRCSYTSWTLDSIFHSSSFQLFQRIAILFLLYIANTWLYSSAPPGQKSTPKIESTHLYPRCGLLPYMPQKLSSVPIVPSLFSFKHAGGNIYKSLNNP